MQEYSAPSARVNDTSDSIRLDRVWRCTAEDSRVRIRLCCSSSSRYSGADCVRWRIIKSSRLNGRQLKLQLTENGMCWLFDYFLLVYFTLIIASFVLIYAAF
jgi:hypothetical protein